MIEYLYYICDVFTNRRFGGNQLAVLPDARGLTDRQLQQIAREFNFSETTFVFPPAADAFRRVRIFSPFVEFPFAGHPNIGTAFVLASIGEVDDFDQTAEIVFEELAGPVPMTLQKREDRSIWCELKAPEPLHLGETVPVDMVAAALSLDVTDLVTEHHPPRVASVGLPFLMVELKDRSALEASRINIAGFEKIESLGVSPFLHLYTRCDDTIGIRARMFAPFDGVPEDPATGSANCALAGLLAHLDSAPSGEYEWLIAQGDEMGRPSRLQARAAKKNSAVTDTWIGGNSVLVSKGVLYLDPEDG